MADPFPPAPQSFGTLKPYIPTARERITAALQNLIGGTAAQRGTASDFAEHLSPVATVAGALPVLGGVEPAGDAYKAGQEGRYGAMAGNLGMAAMGAMPGAGAVGRAVGAAKDPAKMLTEALSSAKANIGGGKSLVAFNPETRAWDLAPGVQGALSTDAPLVNGGRGAGMPPVPQTDLARQVPGAKGVPQRTLDLTSDPAIRQQMMQHIQNGLQMSGENWYDTTALRQRFHDLNGPEQGENDFQRFMQYVGTNSPQNKVPPDIRQASYYYHLDKNGVPINPVDRFGQPIPGQDNTLIPPPYKAMPEHQSASSRVQAGTQDPMDAMKTSSFGQNLAGNYAPVTIDMHALKLPAMLKQDPRWLNGEGKAELAKGTDIGTLAQDPKWWEGSPNGTEYGHLEQWWKSMANDLGITPAQAQAGSWVGGGHITGLGSDENKTFIDFMNDRGNLTAQKTGQGNAQSAIDAFIRGQQPLLGVAGAGALASPLAYGAIHGQAGLQDDQINRPFPPAPPLGAPVQWQ
jgi:hypothetical protein